MNPRAIPGLSNAPKEEILFQFKDLTVIILHKSPDYENNACMMKRNQLFRTTLILIGA